MNLPLHAVEIRQLPPYQLLEYLEKIGRYLDEILRGFPRRYLIGCYQMRGGSNRRAQPYAAQDPHLRGRQPARSAVRRPRPPPEGE